MLKPINAIACWASLLYLSIYLPLATMVYVPTWYQLNCAWHPRCELIGMPTAERGIAELTAFFLHRGELVTRWTEKERSHLTEVRQIYDRMFFLAWLGLIVLVLTYRTDRARVAALINLCLILSLLLVLPVFKPFWQDILHPLLFDNDNWRNTKAELSYYLMPRRFFLHSTAALILAAGAGNLLVLLMSRRLSRTSTP